MVNLSLVLDTLKGVIRKMVGARTIEQTLHVSPVLSSQMEEAIQLWTDMYKNQAYWIHEPSPGDATRVVSLGLPSLIASEKARMALLELSSEITVPTKEIEKENPEYEEPMPDEFGNVLPSMEPKTITEEKPVSSSERAEFLQEQYSKLLKHARRQFEYGIAKGGLIIKPYPVFSEAEESDEADSVKMEFDFIQADCFFPLAFNTSNEITEAAFLETKIERDTVYRRLEYHKWDGSKVEIINKAFKSTQNITSTENSGVDLGKEIPLTEVPEWKDLQPRVMIKNVYRPLFAYFKMPEANTIDTTSPLGVSGYSRAVSLIKDADMQYSRLLWEYEGGEMAVNIDRDAFQWLADRQGDTDKGHSQLPKGQQRLYRQVDVNQEELFQEYAPNLRDASYIQGLNTILMRIEDVTGLSRGTLSDAASEARTATELKILKQRSYQTNADIQQAMEDCLRDVIYIMNVYCDLYEITPSGEYDVNFEWDDSIIMDIDLELNKRITLMNNGLTGKVETRMWYFGETERQAKEKLAQINSEQVDTMEQELIMNQNQLRQQQQFKGKE